MADDFYIAETLSPVGGVTVTDDGTGSDWLVFTGEYYNQGQPFFGGARIYLDGASFTGVATSAWSERIVYNPSGSFVYQTFSIVGLIENAMGGAGTEDIYGNAVANILQGDPGDVAGSRDRLYGFAGDDTLYGMGGDDELLGGLNNDRLFGDQDPYAQQTNIAAGSDWLRGDEGNDTLNGSFGQNILDGGEGTDLADYGGFYADANVSYRAVINLEENSATVYATDLFGGVEERAAQDTLFLIEQVFGTDGNDSIIGRTNFSFGGPGSNTLSGWYGNDTLEGGSWSDTLEGGDGNDLLIAGGWRGPDLMTGGDGDDTYDIGGGDEGHVIVEYAPGGNDTVTTYRSASLEGLVHVENLTSTSPIGANLTGNDAANRLTGNIGPDRLSGLGGADTLVGGADNDTYLNPAGDLIIELAGGGTDTVESNRSISLLAMSHVENVTLTDRFSTSATGNALNNVLNGNSGNNSLDGSAGADTMNGGGGNDTYHVDNAGDVTIELAGGGTDIVSASVSHTLKANIENLNLNGAANIDGNGNTGANVINGNAGNNILRGYAGSDTLNGGGGNDILLGGTSTDHLNPGSDSVRDIIRFSAVADSTGSMRDIVTGMDLTAEDRFDFTVVPTALVFVGGGALSLATINADMAAAVDAALAVNGAVLFDPNAGDMNVAGHLFIVVDANGDGLYRPNQDYLVQLVSSTGFLNLDDFI
jgi:Ca2+-binding RTX toxin-like protein